MRDFKFLYEKHTLMNTQKNMGYLQDYEEPVEIIRNVSDDHFKLP